MCILCKMFATSNQALLDCPLFHQKQPHTHQSGLNVLLVLHLALVANLPISRSTRPMKNQPCKLSKSALMLMYWQELLHWKKLLLVVLLNLWSTVTARYSSFSLHFLTAKLETDSEDKSTWKLLKSLFEENQRTQIHQFLGYNSQSMQKSIQEVPTIFANYSQPSC